MDFINIYIIHKSYHLSTKLVQKYMKLIKTLSNCLDNHLTHIYLKNNTEYWIKTKFRFFPVKNLIQIGERYYIPVKTIIEIAKHANLDIQKQTNYSCFHAKLVAQQYLSNHLYKNLIGEDKFSLLTQQQFVNHDNPNIRLIAANSLLLTPKQVQQLVQDKNPHIRASMALSPLLTMNDFKKLFKDSHYMVKGLTASSPLITIDKMEYLIKNGDFNIKNSVARSPYLDEYPNLVEMLKLDKDKRILRLLDYIGL